MEGETVICVSTRCWNSLWRSTQQIMSRISSQNRVIYFEPGRNPDRSMFGELWRNIPNFFNIKINKLSENLVIVPSPSCLPYARQHLPRSVLQKTTPWVARVNAQLLTQHILRAISKLKVKDPILWLYEPRHVGLLGNFGEKVVCYFNYDEGPNFVENIRIQELLRHYDDTLTCLSDVVFTSGRAQWERRIRINPNTFFIPNGVDFNLFHQALEPEAEIPLEVWKIKRPVIGYVGWMGNQIDVNLLLRIAEVYPQCSLLLVGPDEIPRDASLRRLRAMPNVHFAGQQKLTDLPGFLRVMDVALIPYLLEGYTLTAYPLKLHEYLAAGRAVVATALPELCPFNHVVRIAENHEEFICWVRDALEDCSPTSVEARVAVAREHTWDKRVAEIYRIMQSRL